MHLINWINDWYKSFFDAPTRDPLASLSKVCNLIIEYVKAYIDQDHDLMGFASWAL